ncbi:YuzB family protein [Gracilibacillus xinjiangensis]|uniref:YuzB family protein n=1 Tax=Gracilibacillus xinjiangensis TaxID=1193282 RepID=A0ABV8X3I0_9BACI
MRVNIAFCVKNLAKGSEKVRQQLIKDPDYNVAEYGCTSFCGICSNFYVAIVNGKPIKAESPDELLDNINDYVDTELFDGM